MAGSSTERDPRVAGGGGSSGGQQRRRPPGALSGLGARTRDRKASAPAMSVEELRVVLREWRLRRAAARPDTGAEGGGARCGGGGEVPQLVDVGRKTTASCSGLGSAARAPARAVGVCFGGELRTAMRKGAWEQPALGATGRRRRRLGGGATTGSLARVEEWWPKAEAMRRRRGGARKSAEGLGRPHGREN
jgi:hypothetical protein